MSGPVTKIDEGHGPYGVIGREFATDHELMSLMMRELSDEELSGVVARPVPPPTVEEPEEEQLRPGAFTQAFMDMVPGLKLGKTFGHAKPSVHAALREKRKAERQARKKNRRNR